jgi:hypothetical protein
MSAKIRRNDKGQFTNQITDFELVDIGVEHSQYFQGFGNCGTIYQNSCYGIGSDAREALDDCLENASQLTEYRTDWEALERDILNKYPDFENAKLVKLTEVAADSENIFYHIGLRWND